MGFHFEDIKYGRIDGITIQEMKLNGRVIWPSQAYTYNLYNIRVFDGVNQTNIINAGGTNRLYVLADVDVRSGTTTVKTITDIRLTPVSSPAPEIILSDKPYIKAESRGTVEGPERYTTVICQAYGHTVTVQVVQEANEIVQTTYEMSEATAVPSVYSTIPKEGGLVNIQYNARAAQKLVYTSGAEQTGQMQDMPLYLVAAPTYGDLILTQVQGGVGYAAITIPANLYTQDRQWQFFLYEPISGARGAATTLTQEHTDAVNELNVDLYSINRYTGTATMIVVRRSGDAPTEPIKIYGGRLRLEPYEGASRTVTLDEPYFEVEISTPVTVCTVPLPQQDEEGRARFEGMTAEGYNLFYPSSLYSLYAPSVYTYEMVNITIPGGVADHFRADGSAYIYWKATLNLYRNGVLINQTTVYPEMSVPSPPPGLSFYIDGIFLKCRSRANVVGPQETVEVLLRYSDSLGSCEATTTTWVQENVRIPSGDRYEVPDESFYPDFVGDIPASGGYMDFHYAGKAIKMEAYTAGRYSAGLVNTDMQISYNLYLGYIDVEAGEEGVWSPYFPKNTGARRVVLMDFQFPDSQYIVHKEICYQAAPDEQ
jgi:hypothetical protein